METANIVTTFDVVNNKVSVTGENSLENTTEQWDMLSKILTLSKLNTKKAKSVILKTFENNKMFINIMYKNNHNVRFFFNKGELIETIQKIKTVMEEECEYEYEYESSCVSFYPDAIVSVAISRGIKENKKEDQIDSVQNV